jgi:Sortase domain
LAQAEWRRVAGLRVVVSWPDSRFAPPLDAQPMRTLRALLAGLGGILLILTGTVAVGVVLILQHHAPQPAASAAGALGPDARGPWLRRSPPVSVDIPAIGVDSKLLHLGENANGTVQVPPLTAKVSRAAWYKYSPTPGQIGAAVIEGHVDTRAGPAIFFRLGALRPGNRVYVHLADGVTAIFRVTGVRQYLKSRFPAKIIYGRTHYAALHLITCGGAFDYATGHYLSSTVVFATLTSSWHTGHHQHQH